MMDARIATEFKCIPELREGTRDKGDRPEKPDVPYNIDGDPVAPAPMHARIIRQGLRVFWTPREVRLGLATP